MTNVCFLTREPFLPAVVILLWLTTSQFWKTEFVCHLTGTPVNESWLSQSAASNGWDHSCSGSEFFILSAGWFWGADSKSNSSPWFLNVHLCLLDDLTTHLFIYLFFKNKISPVSFSVVPTHPRSGWGTGLSLTVIRSLKVVKQLQLSLDALGLQNVSVATVGQWVFLMASTQVVGSFFCFFF